MGKSGGSGGGELQAALPFGSSVPSSLASAAAVRRRRSPPWCRAIGCAPSSAAHRSNDSRDDKRSQRQENEKKKKMRRATKGHIDNDTFFFFFFPPISRRGKEKPTHAQSCWRRSGSEERVRSAPIQGRVEKKIRQLHRARVRAIGPDPATSQTRLPRADRGSAAVTHARDD